MKHGANLLSFVHHKQYCCILLSLSLSFHLHSFHTRSHTLTCSHTCCVSLTIVRLEVADITGMAWIAHCCSCFFSARTDRSLGIKLPLPPFPTSLPPPFPPLSLLSLWALPGDDAVEEGSSSQACGGYATLACEIATRQRAAYNWLSAAAGEQAERRGGVEREGERERGSWKEFGGGRRKCEKYRRFERWRRKKQQAGGG